MGMAAYLVLLAANLVAFVYAAVLIVEGALAAGPRYIDLYVLVPYDPFAVGETYDVTAGVFVAYFALVAAGIVGAYAWYGFRDARATATAFTRPLADFRARLEARSAWVATGQVFLAVLFFQFALIFLLGVAGFEPELPGAGRPVPDWYQYYALANASVYEEVVARWILIGVPLAFVALAMRHQASAAGAPAWWRHLLGGTLTRASPTATLLAAAVLIPASSVIFGLAHVPAWGWWKFFPAMVAGLGMGYLFVRHGILAAVMFHFATDYLGALALFSGDNFGAQVLLGVFILVLVGFGAFFFIGYLWYAARLQRHFAGTRPPDAGPEAPISLVVAGSPPGGSPASGSGGPGVAAPSPADAAYGYGWIAFVCPRCGHREARYEGGRFTCLRCGHASP
jgi:hypothetical protein